MLLTEQKSVKMKIEVAETMKKTWISVLLAAVLLLSSCTNISTESTVETTSAMTTAAETTSTEIDTSAAKTETTPMTSPCEAETTAQSITETQETELDVTTSEYEETEQTSWATGTTYESLPEFQGFMEFAGEGRGTFWQGKADITTTDFRTHDLKKYVGAIFRIIGVKDPNYYDVATLYYVQVVKVYGEASYDPSTIYCMAYKGTYESTLYGRPPLEIGKDYLYLIGPGFAYVERFEEFEYMPLVQMGLMMPVVQDGNKTYVYGYGVDFSGLQCAIEITDEEENQIYKVGTHDAIIAKLNDIGMRLPTFDYKCELEEMLREIDVIE